MRIIINAKRCWAEWKQRHQPLFSATHPPTSSLPSSSRPNRNTGWAPPSPGSIKLNFDGSFSPSGSAAAFILRDHHGRLLKAGTRFLFGAPIIVAEATALRDGLQEAISAGIRHLQIEGDNLTVIKSVQGLVGIPWKIQMLISDIRASMLNCELSTIRHIYKESNRAADWLARNSVASRTSLTYSVSPSPLFSAIMYDDCLGSIP